MPPFYGYLAEGAVATVSGFRWPRPVGDAPGAWVQAGEGVAPHIVRGIPVEQFPWWLDDELWEVELDGDLVEDGRTVAAERARLVRRIDAWTDAVAAELVTACEERVRAAALHDYADDIALYAPEAGRPAAGAAVAAYIAAHALAGGDQNAAGYEDAFERERRWQVAWLRRRLQL